MFKEILLPVDLQQTELTERAVAIAKDCASSANTNTGRSAAPGAIRG